MANPVMVVCTKDTWVKVATAVTTGMVRKKIMTPTYLHTYRMTGGSAPSDQTDAAKFLGDEIPISASAAIDVYIKAVGKAGKVRVDL